VAAPNSILIIKPSAIGDVAQTVPVVRAMASLMAARDGHSPRTGWVINGGLGNLLVGLPFITTTHLFHREKMRGLANFFRGRKIMADLVRELRAANYDVAIDLQGLLRSASIGRMSRAKSRIGFANAREMAPMFYTKSYAPPRPRMHAVDRYIGLAAAFLGMDAGVVDAEVLKDTGLGTTDAELVDIRALISHAGYRGGSSSATPRPIVLCPGARWPSKQWPAASFAALAKTLSTHTGEPCLLAGAPNERNLCDTILDQAGPTAAISLAGQTNLRQMAALMKAARLVISNDSGPMHMASLQGAPLVALFGPTDPVITGPWRRMEDVIRSRTAPDDPRAFRRIPDDSVMKAIPVEEVVAAAIARIEA